MTSGDRVARRAASAWEHLDWQFDFLRSSLERYEAGSVHEALRLATVLRILCNDSTYSTSLLQQLDLKESWQWRDTANNGDGRPAMFWGFLRVEMPSGRAARYAARLGDDPDSHRWVNFAEWWSTPVLTAGSEAFSRSDLVRFVANQDGGAHVDPTLSGPYYRLSRANGLGLPGWAGPDPGLVVRTPVWESVRQIAFEVESTAHHFLPERRPEPIGRESTYPAAHVYASWVETSESSPAE